MQNEKHILGIDKMHLCLLSLCSRGELDAELGEVLAGRGQVVPDDG